LLAAPEVSNSESFFPAWSTVLYVGYAVFFGIPLRFFCEGVACTLTEAQSGQAG
jgi:hypothetical protein